MGSSWKVGPGRPRKRVIVASQEYEIIGYRASIRLLNRNALLVFSEAPASATRIAILTSDGEISAEYVAIL